LKARRKYPLKRIVVYIYLLVFLVPFAYTERLMRILVYPFENQGEASYSWLSAGMTDLVIADLGRIGSVEVITDADRKKAESRTVKVVDVIKAVITDNERSRIKTKQRPELTAYEYYAKGFEIQDTDPSGALRLFNEALAVDPEYADALLLAGYTAGCILNRFAEGLAYLEKASGLLKKLNQSETADYTLLLMNMALVYEKKGQKEAAGKLYIVDRSVYPRKAKTQV